MRFDGTAKGVIFGVSKTISSSTVNCEYRSQERTRTAKLVRVLFQIRLAV